MILCFESLYGVYLNESGFPLHCATFYKKTDFDFMISKTIYLTTEDHNRLQKIVNQLIESGDKSETIKNLQYELKRAVIVQASALPDTVAALYSTVRLKDLETGEVDEWTLTMPEDADTDKQRLSVLAPVGTAIIGLSTGDDFDWETPGGIRRLKIESVVHGAPPEKKSDPLGIFNW